ncbi:MAG: hypothetical protein R2708_27825 [Vicinamibacterales bacterium]
MQNLILNGTFGFYLGGATGDLWASNTVVNACPARGSTSTARFLRHRPALSPERAGRLRPDDLRQRRAVPAAALVSSQDNVFGTATVFYG